MLSEQVTWVLYEIEKYLIVERIEQPIVNTRDWLYMVQYHDKEKSVSFINAI